MLSDLILLLLKSFLLRMISNERLRTVGRHLLAVLWIYLRFIVLAVIIFYLVEWYIREYDDGASDESEQKAAKPTNVKEEL